MDVTVKETGRFECVVTVQVPSADVDRSFNEKLKVLSKEVNLPGFRPGKAPRHVLMSRFRNQITDDLLQELVGKTYSNAIVKSEQSLTMPAEISNVGELVFGKDFIYDIHLQVFPKIDPKGYKGIELKRPMTTPTEEDVDQAMERLRDRHAHHEQNPSPGYKARNGDQVMMDFHGLIDGELFDGGSGEGITLTLGEGRFIPGFEEQLLGVEAKESRDVRVTFPKEYSNKDVAGKEALFQCRIQVVYPYVMPDLNDDFAKQVGFEEGGIAALREAFRENILREIASLSEQVLRWQIYDALLESNRIEFPKKVIDYEVQQRWEEAENEPSIKKLNAEDRQKMEEQTRPFYEKSIQDQLVLSMTMRAVMDKEGLGRDIEKAIGRKKMSDAEWDERARQKILDWIMGQSTVTEEPLSFEELIKRGKMQ